LGEIQLWKKMSGPGVGYASWRRASNAKNREKV